jgi:hypothetical protein
MRKPPPSARDIQAALPGRIYYGENLVLIVRRGGTRSWMYRYTSPVTRRATETSIGPFPAFSYADARQAATQMQAQVAKGIDPVRAKREERASQITWEEACDNWIACWSSDMVRSAKTQCASLSEDTWQGSLGQEHSPYRRCDG